MHARSQENDTANWLVRDGFGYLLTGDILDTVAKQAIRELKNNDHHEYCSLHLDKNM